MPKRKAAKKRAGRPPFRPTDEQRQIVGAMCGYGIPEHAIALSLNIAPMTLRKYFRSELSSGLWKVRTELIQTAVRGALGTPADPATGAKAIPPNPILNIFLLKTMCGFRENGPPPDQAPAAKVRVIARVKDADGTTREDRVEDGDDQADRRPERLPADGDAGPVPEEP